jgi:hypothetical protein
LLVEMPSISPLISLMLARLRRAPCKTVAPRR